MPSPSRSRLKLPRVSGVCSPIARHLHGMPAAMWCSGAGSHHASLASAEAWPSGSILALCMTSRVSRLARRVWANAWAGGVGQGSTRTQMELSFLRRTTRGGLVYEEIWSASDLWARHGDGDVRSSPARACGRGSGTAAVFHDYKSRRGEATMAGSHRGLIRHVGHTGRRWQG